MINGKKALKHLRHTVSVIVPAYNEEKCIKGVLSVLTRTPLVNEVIVVNDGSTDKTDTIIRSFSGIRYIRFFRNHGKGYAIAHGVKKATGSLIVFIDADLVHLTPRHIEQLVAPLMKKEADWVIGYPDSFGYKFLIPLSGIRAYFRRDILPLIDEMKTKGYGLELFLNNRFSKKRIQIIKLSGVLEVVKYKKQAYDDVVRMTLKETRDLFDEFIQQDNPPRYFFESYLYIFYLKRLHRKLRQKTEEMQEATDRYRKEFDRLLSFIYD